MLRTKRMRVIIATFTLSILSSVACSGVDPAPKTILAFHSAERWDGGHMGLQLDTLEIIELTCPQEARRLLVSHSNGSRVVIDRVFEPTQGKTSISLSSDDHEWSLTVLDETDRRVAIQGIGDYGGQILWRQPSQQDGDWTIQRSATLNGQQLSVVTTALQDDTIGDQLRDTLLRSQKLATIAEAMPPETAELVLLLESIVTSPKGRGTPMANLLPILEIAGDALRASSVRGKAKLAQTRWTHEPKGGGSGVELIAGSLRDFVAQFESIASTRDPLAGLHGPADGGCPAKVLGE